MRALFDISILLALLDQDHMHHDVARAWWAAERRHGWASCPISQNGFVRIISQPAYRHPKLIADAVTILDSATQRPDHEFWPDDLSILDTVAIDHTRLLGPRQLTDIYLLALAVKHGGRLVTLDSGISVKSVREARPESLVVLK